MLDTIKLVNKQLTDKLEEIQIPKIKKILMKFGNIENDNDFKCIFCNNWSGKNKASLGAHMRNCKFNPKIKDQDNSPITIIESNKKDTKQTEHKIGWKAKTDGKKVILKLIKYYLKKRII